MADNWISNKWKMYSFNASVLMHQSIPPAPSPPPPSPGLLRGIYKFCTARGLGICQPRGHSRAFDTHAVSYQNITIHMVLLEKKQIGSSVKDRNKLKRVIKACSRFYACISSLLVKPELHSENRSYRRESTFFSYWIKFRLTLFEEHLFIFIKLFITYNVGALY